MKRWFCALLALILILLCMLAYLPAGFDPEDFTGEWFLEEEAEPYVFREGIIYRHDQFQGAYCFSRDRVLLFLSEEESVIRELYLIRGKTDDVLSESEEDTGNAVFHRKPYSIGEE